MSDSGEPAHWPFVMFDPPSFKCPQRAVTRVFLHCSAWNGKVVGQQLAETINEWHKANGWTGVGYHFLVDHVGGVCTGRDIETTPAAQLGEVPLVTPDMVHKGNVATIAIMTNGLWDFTEAALESTWVMCKCIDEAYKLAGKPVTFHGHTEIDPRPCPVYDYKSLLGLDEKGNFNIGVSNPISVVAERVREKAASEWHHT